MENYYKIFFENNPQPMWIYDIETLKFLEVNNSAVLNYGYTSSEFLEMTLRDIRPQTEVRRFIKNVIEQHGSLMSSKGWKHIKKDGRIIDVKITSYEIRYNDRDCRLVIAHDITEELDAKRNLEETLNQNLELITRIQTLNENLENIIQERTEKLEEANRELEAFSYSVSHDLRAPLRHITGFIQLLKKEYGKDISEKEQKYFDHITGAAKKMSKLIEDLLSFSRMNRMNMNNLPVNLNHLLTEVINEQSDVLGDREVKWVLSDLPEVNGDAAMLKLVYDNLISNALKFTRYVPCTIIEAGAKIMNGEYIFYVKDNGEGFDMKYADKLFGVFQRLHDNSRFEGTGIGLANVKRIIGRHGGRVWAESSPGQGAAIYFTIPV